VPTTHELPFIDEHCVTIDASPEATWGAVMTFPKGMTGSTKKLYASAVGARDVNVSGLDHLEVGSTFPGFHVVEASPPTRLLLEGQHRFSRYALDLNIEEMPGQKSRLCAETRAEFPHFHGAIYRSLVIGSRIHAVLVRRILRAIKDRAERPINS
jgi:hypothetical protein